MKYNYLDCLASFGVGGAHPGGLFLTKTLLEREKLDPHMSILDAGCGTGQTSAYLATKYQCHVTSLDCNEIMLQKARYRFKESQLLINVKNGTTERLPFPDGMFDIVLSESVIAFTDIPSTLSEFKRVLKRNGILLAVEMCVGKKVSEEELTSIRDFYGISQLLIESEWEDHLLKADFQNISVEKFNLKNDPQDVENASDFHFSNHIDEQYYDILEQHEHITKNYTDILSYRVLRCRC